jgi:hypothetical protein
MTRSAISLIGILCLVIWACAPQAPPPPPMVTSAPASITCADGSDLLTRVQYLRLAAIPDTNLIIQPDQTPINPAIQTDLAAAFKANPAFSKNELCPLDGIFINREGCSGYEPSTCSSMQETDIADNSWGLRTPSNKKYIAISLGLWRCAPGSPQSYCAPSFTEYHQRLVKALLDRTAGLPAGISPPTFQTSNNSSSLAVLAALAHERGHIYWFETFVVTPHDTPSPAVLMSEANAFCGGAIYRGGRWQGQPVHLPQGRYVFFAELSGNSPVNVANLPTLLRSRGAADASLATGVIDGIYGGGQYPSLLAAYSPDEDFVEAFEWSVLRNAGLRDLTANGHPILRGGAADLRGTEAKLACFDALSR